MQVVKSVRIRSGNETIKYIPLASGHDNDFEHRELGHHRRPSK